MFLKHVLPLVGLPLGGESPKKRADIEPGSDMPFGYLLHAHEEKAPRQKRFFDANYWRPPE